MFLLREQFNRIVARQNPIQALEFVSHITASGSHVARGSERPGASDIWRQAALFFFWLSLATLLFGSGSGARVVMLAKQASAKP
jgi:hypothetical protein